MVRVWKADKLKVNISNVRLKSMKYEWMSAMVKYKMRNIKMR